MSHKIEATRIAEAIEEAEVEVTIDRAIDCSVAGSPAVCAGLQAEDHADAIKVLVALAATHNGYEEARLLCDTLSIQPSTRGVTYAFPGVIFEGPLTASDERASSDGTESP